MLAASPAAAQAPAAESVAEVPGRTITLVGLPASRSPFAGLFGAVEPVGFRPGDIATLQGPTRACDGCPRRRPVRAILQTIGVNVVFNLGGRLRAEPDEYKVTPSSWWENLRHGFEWDYNGFKVNQFGHPYQGSLYFNAGRANGLSFWESAPLVALGSATWEYFGERNYAAINDFVTTTMGGMALGEMFYRAGWLIRDTRLTGRSRLLREILATAVDPITGANRFVSGDASRVSENPPGLKPPSTKGDFEVGVQWNGGINQRAVNSTGKPFVGLRLGYDDIYSSPFKQPYDAFSVSLRLGGGAGISEAMIRGRLYGRFLGDNKERPTEFLVAQAYDYEVNGVFDYGGQSVVVGLSHLFRPSDSVGVAVFGLGGPILLGAITSALITETPTDAEAPQRTYDFGPGAAFGGGAALRVGEFPVARLGYNGFLIQTVSAVEGANGQHFAQVVRLDLLFPLWRNYRLGFSGDYINRATYYNTIPDVHQWIPQFRVFLARVSR
jgi:hypothetical protein